MPELTELVRDAVTHQADRFEPADDLPQRITRRVRRRVVERRVMALAAVVAVLVVTGGAMRLMLPGGAEEGTVETFDAPAPGVSTTGSTEPEAPTTEASAPGTVTGPPTMASRPTTTTAPTTTSTTEPPATTTTTSAPGPSGPITSATPLNRSGIGEVVAGMTLGEAQQATGMTFSPHDPIGAGSTCRTAGVEGTGLWFLMHQAGDDPLDAVIQSAQGGASTVEGIALGDTLDDLRAAYGEPTRSYEYPYQEGAMVHTYESGGFAYGITVDGTGEVIELESGLPDSVGNLEGCA